MADAECTVKFDDWFQRWQWIVVRGRDRKIGWAATKEEAEDAVRAICAFDLTPLWRPDRTE